MFGFTLATAGLSTAWLMCSIFCPVWSASLQMMSGDSYFTEIYPSFYNASLKGVFLQPFFVWRHYTRQTLTFIRWTVHIIWIVLSGISSNSDTSRNMLKHHEFKIKIDSFQRYFFFHCTQNRLNEWNFLLFLTKAQNIEPWKNVLFPSGLTLDVR